MTTINVSVDDAQVLTVLRRMAERFQANRMRPAMKEIGEKLAASTRRRFDTATAPDGAPWAPLKSGSVLARIQSMTNTRSAWTRAGVDKGRLTSRAAARALHPLVATGRLRGSVAYQVIDGGAGVAVGVKRNYGNNVGPQVHQFGAIIRPRTKKALAIPMPDGSMRFVKQVAIPARPFLGLSEDDKTTVLDVLNRMLFHM
jgi:phage gpG-like protein